MNAVGLGTLDEVADPARGADVPMVKIFRDGGESGVEGAGDRIAAENEIDQGGADEGVDENFQRVLVEAGEEFDAGGAVMELVAEPPEEGGFVADAVPPVVNKGGDEIGDQRGCGSWQIPGEMEQAEMTEPTVPCESGQDDDAGLGDIEEDDAPPPAADLGECRAGTEALDDDKDDGEEDKDGNEHAESLGAAGARR